MQEFRSVSFRFVPFCYKKLLVCIEKTGRCHSLTTSDIERSSTILEASVHEPSLTLSPTKDLAQPDKESPGSQTRARLVLDSRFPQCPRGCCKSRFSALGEERNETERNKNDINFFRTVLRTFSVWVVA